MLFYYVFSAYNGVALSLNGFLQHAVGNILGELYDRGTAFVGNGGFLNALQGFKGLLNSAGAAGGT